MNGEAGKGDKRRPTNEPTYREKYDKIFNKGEDDGKASSTNKDR